MLIKFTGGGQGGGGAVAAYLTAPDREGRDHAPPEVVRGDIDRTRGLIDSIDRQWSYTHGVVSFALEDAPASTLSSMTSPGCGISTPKAGGWSCIL